MANAEHRADKLQEDYLNKAIAAARGDIKPGVMGDCDVCGEWSLRLVDEVCAQCRDKFQILTPDLRSL